MASAATALEPKIKRRRSTPEPPPRFSYNEVLGHPLLPIGPAMDALTDIASDPCSGDWDWDASRYLTENERPPSMKRLPPDLLLLNNHSRVLLALFRLKPNGHISRIGLRDVLIRLHNVFGIFPKDSPVAYRTFIPRRAAKAAERWSAMCVECISSFLRDANNVATAHFTSYRISTFPGQKFCEYFVFFNLRMSPISKRNQ